MSNAKWRGVLFWKGLTRQDGLQRFARSDEEKQLQ